MSHQVYAWQTAMEMQLGRSKSRRHSMRRSRRHVIASSSPQRAISYGKPSERSWNDWDCPWRDGMPHILYVSVPMRHKAAIQNFTEHHPEICMSKLVVELLLNYISTKDPQMLTGGEIVHRKEPNLDDCKWLIAKYLVKTRDRLGHTQVVPLLAKFLHTSNKIATDRWNVIRAAPKLFGFEMINGFLYISKELAEEYTSKEEKGNAISTSD